jgi:uracil-DNA glycosylase family 4
MKRVIIIEGPDNLGKTTFAKQLAKQIGAVVRHAGAPVKKGAAALVEQRKKLANELAALEEDNASTIEIWDRSIIGEAVYGPLYRTDQYDHTEYFRELVDLNYHEARIFVIVLYADEETLKKFALQPKGDEKELYQKASQTAKVATAFVDVVTKLRLKHTLFVNCNNYATLDERNEYLTKRVNEWLKRKPFTFKRTNDYSQTFFNRTQRLWVMGKGFNANGWLCDAFLTKDCEIAKSHRTLKMFGGGTAEPIGGVGAFNNVRYIFVGEATGYNSSGEPQLGMPFYNGESGCLFQKALSALKIVPTRYYVTNVVKCNPKDNKLRSFVDRDSRPKLECVGKLKGELHGILAHNASAKLIAIGKVAAEELARLRFDYQMMYHPSYYLHHGRSDDFVADLGKVLL